MAVTPILMLGGIYLCYEGAEKLWELVGPHDSHAESVAEQEPADEEALVRVRSGRTSSCRRRSW